MTRGIGEFELIQELIPEWLAVLIALLTQLGDVWFLVLLLGILYWTRPALQDELVSVAGVFLAGLGAYIGLKEVFGLPRPDEPLLDPALLPTIIRPVYELTATASGYGFPSGHATNATMVYLGLAFVLPIGTFRQRIGGAATLILLIGFSRVALGVHYAVDIVAGIAVGAAFLLVGFRLLDVVPTDRGTSIFALAVGTSAFNVAVRGIELEPVVLLGATLGLFGGWQLVMLARVFVLVPRPSAAVVPLAARGGLGLLALGPLVAAIEWFPLLEGPPYPIGGIVGLAAAVVLIIPIARYSRRVRRATTAVRFWLAAGVTGVAPVFQVERWRRVVQRLKRFVDRRVRE